MLNRGEAYHRLRRAVSFVNGGKFRVKTESDQQIWNECAWLITNAIIYYNTVVLSRVYELKIATGDKEAQIIIEGVSSVAWQNVNIFGSFDFNPSTSIIDIDTIVARFDDPEYWCKVLKERHEPPLG